MRISTKTAMGGIIAALSTALMFSAAVFPFLTYALPAGAAVLLIPLIIEVNKKWAAAVFAVVSVLSLLFVADKEAAVMYAGFFGYYPIIKPVLESRLPKWLEWIAKLLIFNGAVTAAYYIMISLMGIELEELERFGWLALPILLLTGSVTFVIYDFALTKMISLYVFRWQKRFRAMFK